MLLPALKVCVCAMFAALLAGCNSAIVEEAGRAEGEGEVINNEIMGQLYPKTFRPGKPAYLERDFEAGADFICDQIKLKYERDICAEPEMNWRR